MGIKDDMARSARSVLTDTTRVEIIDHTLGGAGRVCSYHNVPCVSVEFQDGGRTLKVFLSEKVNDQRR